MTTAPGDRSILYMPAPGNRWWHVMFSTHCAWLPGDERGFRSKHHRIHSSGDYKSPPPATEHAGLRLYHESRHPQTVRIPSALRRNVAKWIAQVLEQLGQRVLIVSVSEKHAHLLAELPSDLKEFNRVVGMCKSKSSRAIKSTLPGQIWARKDKHILVRDRAQRKSVYLYLRDKQGRSAASWHLNLTFE
ncbi:MAG: hypothetical protein ACREJC_23355 [Tepidisphaeraceae bacterium]